MVPPLTGVTFVTEPARLRGAPTFDTIVLTAVDNEVPVEVFGITEAGDWLLIRVNGTLGWMFIDLILINGDPALLPRYRTDGTPLDPAAPAPPTAPAAAAALLNTNTPTETPPPTATATPLSTPELVEPQVVAPATERQPPGPSAGDNIMTINGGSIPANPLADLPVLTEDQQRLTLRLDSAVIQIWGGLFGDPEAGWVSASSELLWEGARLYVVGRALPDEPRVWMVDRVRVVALPAVPRSSLLTFGPLAESVANNNFMAFLGSEIANGVYLLGRGGVAQPLWGAERDAMWLGSELEDGMIVATADLATGRNGFTWVRTDGSAIQIAAQPLYRIRGITGDERTGVWWIEEPQALLDQWQLWHYDPRIQQVQLRLQANRERFTSPGTTVSLSPMLLGVSGLRATETIDEPQLITLYLDTIATRSQQPYQGLFQLQLRLPATGVAEIVDAPQRLLVPDTYRGPVRLSPDGTQLAHLAYDETLPGLATSTRTPPNTLRLLSLQAADRGTVRVVYTVNNNEEFLAPNLEWLGNDRLQLVRSRFEPGSTVNLDRFGVVDLRLPTGGNRGAIVTNNYVLRRGYSLRDTTVCRGDQSYMMIEENDIGAVELVRWDGEAAAVPLFGLPGYLTRPLLCWQSQ